MRKRTVGLALLFLGTVLCARPGVGLASQAAGTAIVHEARVEGRPEALGQPEAHFGRSVSVYGDTMVVGSYREDTPDGPDAGAAYVFVRSGTAWSLQQKLLAADAAPGQRLGFYVSLHEDTAVIGATGVPGGGAAYVFVRSGTTWTQQQRLVASDRQAGDGFGYTVSLDADTVVIGAEFADTPAGQDAGAAYVFLRSGTTWSQQQKLVAPDGTAAAFFVNVAVAGDTVVVGADAADTPGGADTGAAYVFVRSGTVWSLQQKLLAPDGGSLDEFGWSVAVSGDTAVIASPNSAGVPGGAHTGAAYVFVRSGTTWSLQQKLLASDGEAADGLGWMVSISGDTVGVGAYRDDTPAGVNAGSVSVFVRSGTTWSEEQKLVAPDGAAADVFGSVSVWGDTLAAGADFDDTPGGANAGSAWAFVRSGGAWSPQQRFWGTSGSSGFTEFGASLAAAPDTVVIGAPYEDTAAGTEAGAAYVFVRAGSGWMEQQKLVAPDGAGGDGFGWSVAMSGDTVVVGAAADNTPGGLDAGSVYVFVRAGTTWSLQQKLEAAGGAAGDVFGSSVSVSGDTLVAGAYGDDEPQGADVAGSAYVFTRSGTAWTQQQRLAASDAGTQGHRFGESVSVSGDTVLVGAPHHNSAAGSFAGAAYVFVRSGTTWSEQQKLLASDGAPQEFLGRSVSLSGDTAVVGVPGSDTGGIDAGAAYVFVRSGAAWSEQQKLLASDGASFDAFGGAVSVSGDAVVVGASRADVAGLPDAGAAYAFERTGTAWSERQKLLSPDGMGSDQFGRSVSNSGGVMVVGSPWDDTVYGPNAGSAHVFREVSTVADMAVSQTDAPDPVVGLQTVSYTVHVANLGPAQASAVALTDVLPAGVTFQAAGGAGWTCGEAAGVVTCSRPTLATGAAPAITVVVTAPPQGGSLTNVASVSHAGSDPASTNNTASETTTVTAAPTSDVSVAMSDGGVEARWGQAFTWTITVANAGPDAIASASVADAFPAGVAGVVWACSASGGASCPTSGSGNVAVSVGLPSGGSVTFTATGTVTPGTASLTNTATVTLPAGVHDPTAGNNSASLTTGAGPIQYFTLTPCRVVDTRPASALGANSTRTFTVGGQCGVPADARAVAANVVAVGPGALGNLRLYPTGQALPQASALNFAAGRTRANNAILALGLAGQLEVRCDMPPGSTASTHFVLDVFGYFR